MNRQEKKESVSVLKDQFSQSAGSVVVAYKGLSVPQLQKLRKGIRENGGSFKIAKTTLMKLAVEDIANAQPLTDYFKDQIGLVFVPTQSQSILKYLYDFSQENEGLKLVAGMLDAQLLKTQELRELATLPSREVLLARLCGILQAPVAKLAFVLQQASNKKQ